MTRQFFPAPSTAPLPPIRDAKANIVGGERLTAFNLEVDDLARHLHGATRFGTIAEAVRNIPVAYTASLEIVLKRHEFTQAFTAKEIAELQREEEQARQRAASAAKYKAERDERERVERIDLDTREQARKWTPKSAATQRNSPAWHIERGHFVESLNLTRAKAGLGPLNV